VRSGLETADDLRSPRRAFATGLAATASNPLTIASWAAILAAASVAGTASSVPTGAAMVAGVGVASLGWFAFLTLAAERALRRLGSTGLALLDATCGVGLVGFGGLLGVRVATADP
jgi:threonine/homoserine/homoserine lactone efflux protein